MAKVLYFVRHAHAVHNEAQERVEAQMRADFPHIAAPHAHSGSSARAQELPREYTQRRKQAMRAALNGEGMLDAALSRRGRAQLPRLRRVAEHLARGPGGVQLVLSSSLTRTLSTARPPPHPRPRVQHPFCRADVWAKRAPALALTLQLSTAATGHGPQATAAFADLGVPLLALDELREVAGAFACERRRGLPWKRAVRARRQLRSCKPPPGAAPWILV